MRLAAILQALSLCVAAFRLACRSFYFADEILFALYHNPPPYKKSRGLDEVCEHSQIYVIFSGYFNEKAHAQQKSPEIFISELSFKSATTYFHAPFPANYLGHE